MTTRSILLVALILAQGTISCTAGGPQKDTGGLGPADGGNLGPLPDGGGGPGYGDTGPVDECNPSCGPEELCGTDGEGDGVDNDCDGTVDEGCICPAAGVTKECFLGPPDRRYLGTCSDGVMTCGELRVWGQCSGGRSPSEEVCDGADNDCNGEPDDTLTNCSTSLQCPGTQQTIPLSTHLLNGSAIFPGAAQSYHWEIECPPTVSPCPEPAAPDAADTEIYFFSSGSYHTRFTVVTPSGEPLSCQWVIRVQGIGLRVELNWDTRGSANGDADVDLHLHRKTLPPGVVSGETDFFNTDDCYYANCKGSWYDEEVRSSWGMEDTVDISACSGAPHGEGQSWVEKGVCYNPRLDVDVISCNSNSTDAASYDFCAPENINVDSPAVGQPFRVMVNLYSGADDDRKTYPTVNVFCGGELRGTFGTDPLIVLRNGDSFGESNDNWFVADVVFEYDSCGGLTCKIQPLNQVIQGSDFGPDWSF